MQILGVRGHPIDYNLQERKVSISFAQKRLLHQQGAKKVAANICWVNVKWTQILASCLSSLIINQKYLS